MVTWADYARNFTVLNGKINFNFILLAERDDYVVGGGLKKFVSLNHFK